MHPTFFVLVAFAAAGALGPPASGLVWLTILFGSVVAHQLSHSVVAMRRGVPVRDIVLLPIGGVSDTEQLPDRPLDELLVAGRTDGPPVRGPSTLTPRTPEPHCGPNKRIHPQYEGVNRCDAEPSTSSSAQEV